MGDSSTTLSRRFVGSFWVALGLTGAGLLGDFSHAQGFELPQSEGSAASRNFTPPGGSDETIDLAAKEPARVRIGLKLVTFKGTSAVQADGKPKALYVPQKGDTQTLRARLDRTNHFYVGDWHVQTTPTRWSKSARRYSVRLNFAKRYGAFGQLEEDVGSILLSGILKEQEKEAGVYVLYGTAHHRFKDKVGAPVLEVTAGYRPDAAAAQPVALQHSHPATGKPEAGEKAPVLPEGVPEKI